MMKIKTLLITCFALVALVSCKSDDSGDDTSGGSSSVGTYTLVSITSAENLDPNADGTFDDTELINNINCNSALVLNSDDTFVWQEIVLSQPLDSSGYGGITCIVDVHEGDYTVNDGSLVLNITNITNGRTDILSISQNEVEFSTTRRLVISVGGVPTSRQVALVFKYSK